MNLLLTIIFFNFLGSVVSLIGGALLLTKRSLIKNYLSHLVVFAAGALLGTAFLDLLPEALEMTAVQGIEVHTILLTVLVSILIFFAIERFISWSHHHHDLHAGERKPTVTLLFLGDTLHNFLDGITIAGSFLVSIPLGIVTTFAVGAHEIPQEIGDFAVFLKEGLLPKKVIFLNLLSALASIVGAVLGFFFLGSATWILPYLLAFASGNFMYIALSDLVPEIHHQFRRNSAFIQLTLLIIGILAVYLGSTILEQ